MEKISAFPLPADEQALLRSYRRLAKPERDVMHRVAKGLLDVPATPRQKAPRLTVIEGDVR